MAVACSNRGKEKQDFLALVLCSKCMTSTSFSSAFQNTLHLSSSRPLVYLLHGHYQHYVLSIHSLHFTGNEWYSFPSCISSSSHFYSNPFSI